MEHNGALDALISEGLALQAHAHDLEHLVHQGIPDVLGDKDLSVECGLPPMVPADQLNAVSMMPSTLPAHDGGDVCSNIQQTNGSGVAIQGRKLRNHLISEEDDDFDQDEDDEDEDDEEGANENETSSSGLERTTKRPRNAATTSNTNNNNNNNKEQRKSNMSGRFSGRLEKKGDEKKLADECKMIGHFLCFDDSLNSLATIVRAIASGAVRAHLEKKDAELKAFAERLHLLEGTPQQQVVAQLHDQLLQAKADLERARAQAASAEQDLHNLRHNSNEPAGAQQHQLAQAVGRVPSSAGTYGVSSAAAGVAPAQMPATVSLAPVAPVVNLPVQQAGGMPHVLPAAPSGQPAGLLTEVSAPSALMPPAAVQAAPVAAPVQVMMPSVQSSAQLLASGMAQQQPAMVAVKVEEPSGADTDVAAATAAGTAATSLNNQAQHLAVQATIHAQAKTEAQVHAQHLAVQAQQHAQASVQAAQQAEQLKQTLMTTALPSTEQTQQAVATVQNLEARAQAHASFTNQVVAQARELQDKAQAHEKEEIKAITHATMLQAHAQSLQASMHHLESTMDQAADVPQQQQQQPQQQQHTIVVEQVMPAAPGQVQQVQPVLAAMQPVQVTTSEAMPAGSGLLGNASDVQMAQELGLLPNTPHSNNPANGAIFAATMPLPVPTAAMPVSAQLHPAAVQQVPVQLLPQQAAQMMPSGDQQQQQLAPASLMPTSLPQPVAMAVAPQQQEHVLAAAAMEPAAAEMASIKQQIAVLQAQQAQQQAQQAQAQAQAAVPQMVMQAIPGVMVQALPGAPLAGMNAQHPQLMQQQPLVRVPSMAAIMEACQPPAGGVVPGTVHVQVMADTDAGPM